MSSSTMDCLENGGNGWFSKLTKIVNKRDNQEVFSASRLVEPLFMTSKGKEDEMDPHAWLDLNNENNY